MVSAQQVLEARQVINDIYIDDKVKDYIVDMVCCTRDPAAYKIQGLQGLIQFGARPARPSPSPLPPKPTPFCGGAATSPPRNVKSIGMDVLRHRVTVTYEAEAEEKTSETIITKIFNELPVP